MGAPNSTVDQNLLPVQAYFDVYGNFQTFIGQGKAFYASANPIQSGLTITNSTLDSSPIGSTSPSTGNFTNISTVTGTISTNASSATDIVNFLTLQSYAAGISWKNPVTAATTANITLSGLQTVDTVSLVAGNTVLVKNQTNAAQNGIYTVSSGAWNYAAGCTTWAQYVSALVFVEFGGQAGSAWYCTAQPGGTLGTTAMNWSNFSVSTNYSAGTGLTLTGYVFSITATGVSAATYGSASTVPVIAVNLEGQITSATNTSISINASQITAGTIASSLLSGSYTGITGLGTVTAGTWNAGVIGASYGGTGVAGTLTGVLYGNGTSAYTVATAAQLVNAIGSTAVTNSTNTTNILGGATGSLPYQSAANTTALLAAGTNGQVLTLVSGVPAWGTLSTVAVTSFSGGTTGLLPSTATSGAITLSGTLNVANGGTGITAFGTGVQTALGQSVTGSGGIALSTSPIFVTPTLGAASATSVTSGTFVANKTITTSANAGAFSYGTLGYTDTSIFASFTSSTNSYNQIVLQNTNSGTTASTDYVVSNNLGTASTYYGDFGMNSSGFSGTGSFGLANAVYLQSMSADLVIGTGSSNAVHFVVNGGATDAATITSGGQFQTTSDASIHGLTVGLGGGSVSTNTAFGTSALSSNTTASNNTAVGYQAGYTNSTGIIDAFGYQALYANTTGTANAAFGQTALAANTTGQQNSAFGRNSLLANTTGSYNSALGTSSLDANTTGSNNTAIGWQALLSNTTASNNTAVGYQASYSGTTGNQNTTMGLQSGYSNLTGSNNAFYGYYSGQNTTSSNNTFIGNGAGYQITSGANNTILGNYNGNNGGLDIRTASNYIVLSDGAGNPRGIFDGSGNFFVGGTTQNTANTPVYAKTTAKAWVNFSDNGTTCTINQSFNVSSITRNSTGNYGINFTSGIRSSASCAIAQASYTDGTNANAFINGVNSSTSSVQVNSILQANWCSVVVFD